MHRRLIVAFIVVALLAALASQWVTSLLLPAFPSLPVLVTAQRSHPRQQPPGRGRGIHHKPPPKRAGIAMTPLPASSGHQQS